MKREGKQHGMVKTLLILPPLPNTKPKSRWIPMTYNPTSGSFAKVPSKPTNHSRSTGKCWSATCPECHSHPLSKSRVKSKGCSKMRASDVTYNMLTWQVPPGGTRPCLKLSGFSATGILNLMSDDDDYADDHDYQSDDEKEGDVVEEVVNIQSDDGEKREDGSHDDDGRLSFCDVGLMMIDHVEEFDEEGWCLVEEIMT
ncbi:unnamed protein product [Eruca vesicaria subsp. sativa]|uniref:Uncharacterized protein n=1 Tax=Eruca vesicaria subsp. sativa TaxID=29727 RepID=A0ABC8LQS6_ERUVS|nr:unnamed protein product [Eruca vesicaria subsp. sativa]